MQGLRHLAKYLLKAKHFGVVIRSKPPGEGLLGSQYLERTPIETFSDSDWATCRSSRKSVSASIVAVCGNPLQCASRTQRLIALSSAEAELYAASSTICDGLFIRSIMQFAFGEVGPLRHHLDATAAKGVLLRSGVGKIRHLSCRVLWTQDHVRAGVISLQKVKSSDNPADLGTKGLSRARTQVLLHALQVFDTSLPEYVGEDEHAEQVRSEAFKRAVRHVRARGCTKVPKQAIRELVSICMLSLASGHEHSNQDALSRSFDDEASQPLGLIEVVIAVADYLRVEPSTVICGLLMFAIMLGFIIGFGCSSYTMSVRNGRFLMRAQRDLSFQPGEEPNPGDSDCDSEPGQFATVEEIEEARRRSDDFVRRRIQRGRKLRENYLAANPRASRAEATEYARQNMSLPPTDRPVSASAGSSSSAPCAAVADASRA